MKCGINSWSSCALVALAVGCASTDRATPEFDANRAFAYLHDQVAFGPRVPGSPASAACRDYFVKHFQKAGLTVDSQKVYFRDPYSGASIPLVNVIARHPGSAKDPDRILLAAHYDSRPRTDNAVDIARKSEPIAGANDGASGVAILLELANLFEKNSPETAVDLVLLDGEDWGRASDLDYYSLGAKALAQSGLRDRYRFAIVLDMVGDADQQIYREVYSEQFQKPINDMIWGAAKTLQIATFFDTTRHAVIDDHLPLNVGGVPTVDIIDFDYPYWHTENDTPDKCSAQALGNVGRVITYIAYNRSIWPKN
jgi:Zn-dependent M28 family amino/carboxypeptidase